MNRKLLEGLVSGVVLLASIAGAAHAARRQPALAGRATDPTVENALVVEDYNKITNAADFAIDFTIPLPLDTTSVPTSRNVSVTLMAQPPDTSWGDPTTSVFLLKMNRNGTSIAATADKIPTVFGSFTTLTTGSVNITSGNDYMVAVVRLGTNTVVTSAQYSP